MRATARFTALLTACVGVALWSSSRPAHTQSSPSYGVTDLDTLGGATSSATGLMSGGFPQVVGFADTSSGNSHAFAGNPWQLRDQGTLGGARSALLGASPFGNAVGWSDTSSGAIHAIAAGTSLRDLGTLGGTSSVGTAVNDDYLAVGYSDIAGDTVHHAFLYDLKAGTMSDLGASLGGSSSWAFAINVNNHVAGFANLPGDQTHHAFLFAGGTTTDLGSFGSWSEASAMNDTDVVVGAAATSNGQHAFVYNGSLQDLGTLGGTNSAALSINDSGVIVGWAEDSSGSRRAAIWNNGAIQDLNDLIPAGTGWVLVGAQAIQVSRGTAIVGYGTINGATHAFMLTPPNDFSATTKGYVTMIDTNFPNPIEAGQSLTFAATIRSHGPYSATGVVFTQTLSGPIEITGWRGADSCTQPTPQQIVCRRRSVDFDGEADVFARPTAAGVFTHSISITADQPDPNPSNNTATESNLAVSLLSLITEQPTIVGGQSSLSRATITSPAPQGDAPVKLTSSNPSVASVPSPFDVLAGCCDNGTWREFYVTTSPVSAPTPVTISATYGLVTKTVDMTVVPAGTPYPFSGSPSPIPGTIEAENFDVGGEGVAYHDLDSGNNGGAYRNTDVDIEATTDSGGGYDVGWIGATEWLVYTVNVTSAGAYQLDARVASQGAGGTFHVEFDGTDATGPMTVLDTGGWQAWTTISAPVTLSAGTHLMRVAFDSNGASAAVGNLNWIRFTASSGSGSTPFGGTARALPGLVQAEDFDDGGQNVAYFDTTPGNIGGQYRATDVDIEATTDSGGGYDVGWIDVGEWLNYSVTVTASGSYTLDARVASQGPGGTFHVEMDGANITGSLTIPDTGAWQSWTTASQTVTLAAGAHMMRVVFDSIGASGAVGNLNWISVSASAGAASTPFAGQPSAVPAASKPRPSTTAAKASRTTTPIPAVGISAAHAACGRRCGWTSP